jgi:hypothetical protein
VTAKRIGAVLAAAVLIAAAFLLRRNVIEDDADATQSSAPVTTGAGQAGAVVCTSELAAACTAIEDAHPELAVSVEPAGVTLDRLAQLPDGTEAPVWLTVAPFPEMVDSLRAASGLDPLGLTAEVLAATPLVVATPTGGRAGALASGCAGTPLWRCLGEHAGAPWTELGGEAEWRTVRPSLGVVDREAAALASFADAVAGYLGTPDISRSAWEADPAFIPWLRQLAGAVDESALSAGTPLATMATRSGALDVAATTVAEHAALGATAERFEPSYPEPSMWLQAVLAAPDGTAVPDDLGGLAAEALVEWDAPSAATQPVPSAPTMLALRTLWQEAT